MVTVSRIKKNKPYKAVLFSAFTMLVLECLVRTVYAQDQAATVDTYVQWLKTYANTKVDFKPGDVLTAKDIRRLVPFVPPGYLQMLDFPEFRAKVVAPLAQTALRAYVDCTEKYSEQVRLGPDGALLNYKCGRPFPNASLNPGDRMSGFKAAWNYYWRWVNHGWVTLTFDLTLMRPGANHNDMAFVGATGSPPGLTPGLSWSTPFETASEVAKDYGGGGFIQRYMTAFFARVSFAHLADLDGVRVPVPGAEGIDFKNLTWFKSPFDIRGTAFTVFRYSDQYRGDDAWAYIPNLRRVRRVSAEVKSDSLLGTDGTIDDFDGFNDRVLNWNWKFLGWKDVLHINDPTHYARYYGPNGNIPDDVWSVKRMAVTLRTPTDTRHPYSAVINFWNYDTWAASYQLIFDKKGKLWKIMDWQYKYTETFTPGFWAETTRGAYAPDFWAWSAYDMQSHSSTVFRNEGPIMVKYSPDMLVQLFDISSLETTHR